jgi:hypothetical protein
MQACTSQYRPEQLHQPKLSEVEPNSGNITLYPLAQRQTKSAKPVFRNIQAKHTLSSPGPIEITESSVVVTKGARNVTQICWSATRPPTGENKEGR